MNEMYLFYFYVPEKFKEKVKQACFDAGAGRIGNYQSCSFEYRGIGQFHPERGSSPYVGKIGKKCKVIEIKIEMIVRKKFLKSVMKSFIKSHPYETPAYGFIKIFLPKNSNNVEK